MKAEAMLRCPGATTVRAEAPRALSFMTAMTNRTAPYTTLAVLLLTGYLGHRACAQATAVAPSEGVALEVRVVSRADLEAAMAAEQALPYNASITTNAARHFAGVVYRLAHDAQAANPHGPVLLIRYDDWFEAILNLTGLPAKEAPLHVRLAYDHRQHVLIDYDMDHVIKSVHGGEEPELALSVQVGWPASSDLPSHYSYEDTLTSPRLQVTNHRLIRQRMLYFDDLIVYDQVQGVTGRPTTGPLSLLFKVIGEGRVRWSRMFIASNGIQVVRGKASKGPISVTETFFIRPDGTGEKGLPARSSAWLAVEARLKRMPGIAYHPWRLPDFDPNW